MRNYKYLSIAMFLCVLFACTQNEESLSSLSNNKVADKNILLNDDVYNKDTLTLSNDLYVKSVIIKGDSLKIRYAASGCDGSTWQLKLIASEAIAKSLPPQRSIRLSLKNEELCDAVLEKEVAFNIRELSDSGKPIFLNLEGYDKQLYYKPEQFDTMVCVDNDLYKNAPDDFVSIQSVKIENDSLKISFGASGCDGSTWKLKLIGQEDIMESEPPQRNIRLSLKNEEDCLAYFEKEVTFDISELSDSGGHIFLNLKGYDKQIYYKPE